MNPYLKTGLYHLDTRGIEFDVAHLYEHLLIETFKRNLEKHGFSRYMFGWLGGETFRDIMFIEYGFYNPEVENFFKTFIGAESRIDSSLIANELRRIQSEDEAVITTIKRKAVIEQLKLLDASIFIDHEDRIDSKYIEERTMNEKPNTLKLKRSKRKFRDIGVVFGMPHSSLTDKLVSLRLRPMLLDALDDAVFGIGGYQRHVSLSFEGPGNRMMVMASYTIPRDGIRLKQIETLIRSSLSKLATDIATHTSELTWYFDGFTTTPNWHSFAIDYYRHTGIVTTRKEVANVSTASRLISMINMLEVKVLPSDQEFERVIAKNS